MLEIDKLLLNEIIRLKNINKSLGQKIKHHNDMLLLKCRLIVNQQKCLSSYGAVDNKELFASCSKDLINHLECLREYESRSNVLNLPKVIKLNGKRITALRNAIEIIKEIKCSQP